jgi:hypothetical protein
MAATSLYLQLFDLEEEEEEEEEGERLDLPQLLFLFKHHLRLHLLYHCHQDYLNKAFEWSLFLGSQESLR